MHQIRSIEKNRRNVSIHQEENIMIWIIVIIASALLIELGDLSVQQTRTLLEGALVGEKILNGF